MVGWGKASPKWGRQSGIVLPHSTTPPSESPSTLAASALPRLPHPLQTAWGASGETGEEDFGLGKSHVSVLSQSPHSPPPDACAERGAGNASPGWASGPPLRPRRVPYPSPTQKGTSGPCLSRQAPWPHPARALWRVRFCRREGRRAPCPHPPSVHPFTLQGGPARGREPRAHFLPWPSSREKGRRGRDFAIPPGTGRGARGPEG